MKLPNYLKTENMEVVDGQLYVELRLAKLPDIWLLGTLISFVKFRIWFYPLMIKSFFQLRRKFKNLKG